jgi:CIC family chloride channel protein
LASKNRGTLLLCLLAVLVGVIAGVGAWVFRLLIGFFHNLLFLGKISPYFDANVHTATDVWGAWIIAVPIIGAVGVAWLVKTFAPEAKGHGVPEVMDAIYYNDGKIRPIVVVVKSLASALSIGSGGSVGREGPIIQIGATFGSVLGSWISMPVRQRVVLMAAGAGAGIAATFNAPLGGIIFAVELLLVAVSARNILLVSIATVVSTYIGRMLLGAHPSFEVPALEVPSFGLEPAWGLGLFLPLGLLCGLAGTVFVRSIYWAEDTFDAMPGNYYTRHMLGMAIVGVMIYLMQRYTGHFYVQGVGYATIMDVLMGVLSDPWFLLLLCGLKLIATCLTLGSGASGGVFSPGLFMGATLGAAVGHVSQAVFPEIGIGIPVFAIAGMAAMIGSTTGAVFTSIIMLTEMTADHNVVLPVVLCTATAYAVRRHLSPASIYTLKLNRRGHTVPEGLASAMLSAQRLQDMMTKDFSVLESGSAMPNTPGVIVWTKDGDIVAAERRFAVPGQPEEKLTAGESEQFILLAPQCSLVEALNALDEESADIALVSNTPQSRNAASIIGTVTAAELTSAMKAIARLQ